jgi:dolichol kinase
MVRSGFARPLFHVLSGLGLAVFIVLSPRDAGLIGIGALLLICIVVESLRLVLPVCNRLFLAWVGPLLKETEVGRPTGVGYFLAGAWIVLLVFKQEIAVAALVILAVGDPAAAVVGRRWGRTRIGKKSLEGSFGFFLAAMGTGWLLQGLWPGLPYSLFAVGVLAGTVVEFLPLRVDDNLVLPVATGLAMETVSVWF